MTSSIRWICCALLLVGSSFLKAAPGAADASFGSNGRVELDLTAQGISVVPGPVVVQGDGKIVVACTATAPTNSPAPGDVLLVRYLADGSLDGTFGTAGLAWVNANSVFQDMPVALLALPDGKLLLGTAAVYNSAYVTTEKRYFLLRLDSAGALDMTFSEDGKVPLDITLSGTACLAAQPDGKVLVAGSIPSSTIYTPAYISTQGAAVVQRYGVDGTADSTFGTDGQVTFTPQTQFSMSAPAPAPVPQGLVLSTGASLSSSVIIISPPDRSYESGYQGRAVSVMADGRIVLAGTFYGSALLVARLNSDGAADTTFATSGLVYDGYPSTGLYVGGPPARVVDAVRVTTAGQVRVWSHFVQGIAGSSVVALNSLSATGVPEVAESKANGAWKLSMNGLVLDAQDRPLPFGQINPGIAEQPGIQRMRAGLGLDAGFGVRGTVGLPGVATYDTARSAAVQGDGAVLVAIDTYGSGALMKKLVLARLLAGEDGGLVALKSSVTGPPFGQPYNPYLSDTDINIGFPGLSSQVPPEPAWLKDGQGLDCGKAMRVIPSIVKLLLRNEGSAPVTGLSAAVLEGGADFTLAALDSTTLASGAETTLTLTFLPSAIGIRTGRLKISNDNAANTLSLPLQAIGVEATVTLDAAQIEINESQRSVNVPVRLSAALDHAVTVKVYPDSGLRLGYGSYQIVTATLGDDWNLRAKTTLSSNTPLLASDSSSPASLTFPAGTTVQYVTVHVNKDLQPEGDEYSYLYLKELPETLELGAVTNAKVLIHDDAHATFEVPTLEVSENAGLLSLPLTFTQPAEREEKLYFKFTGTARYYSDYTTGLVVTGYDYYYYTPLNGYITVPKGSAEASVPITLVGDDYDDDGDTLTITFGSAPSPPLAGLKTSCMIMLRDGRSAAPQAIKQPASQLVAVGDRFRLRGSFTGAMPQTYQWEKDGSVLPGKRAMELVLQAAKLTDAGAYQLLATNGQGQAATDVASVSVVDRGSPSSVLVTPGSSVTFTARTAGSGLTYRWRRGGTELLGATESTLVLSNVTAADAGDYTCEVTSAAGSIETLPKTLVVLAGAPRLMSMRLPRRLVGETFSAQVPVFPDPAARPSAFVIKGLPEGVSYDRRTGLISGAAKAAGEYVIEASASNLRGISNTIQTLLQVGKTPAELLGSYVAIASPDETVNGLDLGARLDFTTTTQGTATGTLRLGRKVLPWSGRLAMSYGETFADLVVEVPQSGGITLELHLEAQRVDGQLRSGTASLLSAAISGWRRVWTAGGVQATDYTGYHTFALPETSGGLFGSGTLALARARTRSVIVVGPGYGPSNLGTGHGSLTVQPDGISVVAGKLGDGQALAMTAALGPAGEIAVYQVTYQGQGSLCGLARIANDEGHTLSTAPQGPLFWRKRSQTTFTRLFKDGYGVRVAMEGSEYVRPAADTTLLGIPEAEGNAMMTLTGEGFGDSFGPFVYSIFKLTARSTAVFTPETNGANIATFIATPQTGFFRGTYRLIDFTPAGKAIIRLQPFYGVFAAGRGQGVVELPLLEDPLNLGSMRSLFGIVTVDPQF